MSAEKRIVSRAETGMGHTTRSVIFCVLAGLTVPAWAQPVVYRGTDGPGKGKHIVFLAGDHEYRSEETLPAIARLLAKLCGLAVYSTDDHFERYALEAGRHTAQDVGLPAR